MSSFLNFFRRTIPDTHPLRLFYHKFVAMLAALIYRFPANRLHVIAITGTKGKTTTTHLITDVLREAGYKVGMASTVGFRVGDEYWNNTTKSTTQGRLYLQKLLRRIADERCTHAVLEVSSHAILQHRLWGVAVDTAVITNIGEDHLEYHGGFDNYLRTKGLLFSRLNRSKRKPRIPKVSIMNIDDPHFAYFDQFVADRKYTFGLKGGTCIATNIELSPQGSKFTLKIPNHTLEINIKLPGAFNIMNALAAVAVALANNIQPEIMKKALANTQPVPGRYETVAVGQPFTVIVDYAHTEESLRNLLEFYRPLTKGKLWLVFGATGGGRDKAKRSKMGAIADSLADNIIVTDDDPYEEEEWSIIEDIRPGIQRQEGQGVWFIPTRREAIQFALNFAQPNDTVLIAGKGAETIQMIHGTSIPWNDRQVVTELLQQAVKVTL